jgi:peptide/nickel transport system substrate-binding protein
MLPFSRRAAGFTLFWLLGLLPGLTSCTEPAPPTDERRVFRYNQPESLTSLDPAFARNQANSWAVSQLFNGLMELDSTCCQCGAGPSLHDGRRYTFVLRPGVRFT